MLLGGKSIFLLPLLSFLFSHSSMHYNLVLNPLASSVFSLRCSWCFFLLLVALCFLVESFVDNYESKVRALQLMDAVLLVAVVVVVGYVVVVVDNPAH